MLKLYFVFLVYLKAQVVSYILGTNYFTIVVNFINSFEMPSKAFAFRVLAMPSKIFRSEKH